MTLVEFLKLARERFAANPVCGYVDAIDRAWRATKEPNWIIYAALDAVRNARRARANHQRPSVLEDLDAAIAAATPQETTDE